ncbi:MAG: tRNA (adenosine(37)-N6)-threonylcarbamoyltransferase complex ATPase subunit type 1 TsaE [Actinomycetota bacterium]|nr:tRNA (adenosine(37)-N6)-threonylcarbamoyltransferase complex ATPase subunit type 1 TsaE [Actinomycetota bacterium]
MTSRPDEKVTRRTTKSEAGTKKVGAELGHSLKPGDTVCLYGGLGSGKTVFTKGIASALGIPEADITSASFLLVAEHPGRVPLYHADLYRIEDPAQIDFLGLEEYPALGGITIIEWAERLPEDFDGCTHKVRIGIVRGRQREIIIERAHGF